jgi:FdhD protein
MVMFVSGRCSFEVVQKAAVAGVPLIAAVSAPSSLAVELAEEVGVTLVGFLRGASMNVYTHPERVAVPDRPGEPANPGDRAAPVSPGPR